MEDLEEFDIHVHWLETMVKRILLFNNESTRKPLLSLSYTDKIDVFDSSFPIKTKLTAQDLATGIPFALILHTIKPLPDAPSNLFATILQTLSSLGYNSAGQCNPDLLAQGSKPAQIELMKLIEWAVVDRCLSIEHLTNDMKRLPRSFYILKEQPNMLEDAMSLWLSKFPCSHTLPDITDISTEIFEGQHVAFVLSRVYPKRIPKDEINVGPELTNMMIYKNWDLVMPVLDEIMAFVPQTKKLHCEHLLKLFFADVFYATRPGAKKFVKMDHPPPIHVEPKPYVPPAPIQSPVVKQPVKKEEPVKQTVKKEEPVKRSHHAHAKSEKHGSHSHSHRKEASSGKRRSHSHRSKGENAEQVPPPQPEPQVVIENQEEKDVTEQVKHEEPVVDVPPLDLQLNGRVDPERPSNSARYSYDGMKKQMEARRNSDDFVIDNTNMSDNYVPPLSKASNRKHRTCAPPELDHEQKIAETEQQVEIMSAEDVLDLTEDESVITTEDPHVEKVPVTETVPEDTEDHRKLSKHSSSPKGKRSSRRHSKHSRRRQSSESESSDDDDESYSDDSDDSDDHRRRSHRSGSGHRRHHRSSHRHSAHRSRSYAYSDASSINSLMEPRIANSVPMSALEKFAQEAGRFGLAAQEFSREANRMRYAQTLPPSPQKFGDISTDALALCMQRCEVDGSDITSDDLSRMKKTLEEFANCRQEDQTQENLLNILKRQYPENSPESHIQFVYGRLIDLLRRIASDSSSLPHLLISAATNCFDPPNNRTVAHEEESPIEQESLQTTQSPVETVTEELERGRSEEEEEAKTVPVVEEEEESNEVAPANDNLEQHEIIVNEEETISSSCSESIEVQEILLEECHPEEEEEETQTPTVTMSTQEVETDRFETTHQETQTEQSTTSYTVERSLNTTDGVDIEPNVVEMKLEEPVLLFERSEVRLASADGEIHPIECNVVVKHFPFRRFTSFKRTPPTLRNTTLRPNLNVITAMIRFHAMPSPQLDVKRKQVIDFIQSFAKDRLLVLMATMGLKMKGIYRMDQSMNQVTRIWGEGPHTITEKDVGNFWKYASGAKQLEPIPSKHFTQTTDAITLKRNIEPRLW